MGTFEELQSRLRAFSSERDWGQFHSPKNLVMAIAGEAGELSALMQWVEPAEVEGWLSDRANSESLASEIADVLAYLLLLCDAAGIDPIGAGLEKIAANEQRYPIERSRGTSTKYTEL